MGSLCERQAVPLNIQGVYFVVLSDGHSKELFSTAQSCSIVIQKSAPSRTTVHKPRIEVQQSKQKHRLEVALALPSGLSSYLMLLMQDKRATSDSHNRLNQSIVSTKQH
jgi:hypothetical protein